MGGILRNMGCPLLFMGVPEDHVHLLFCMNRTDSIADVVGKLKASSSSWISERPGDYHGFSWQNGYGAFSVSASGVEEVEAYIDNQVEHHKTVSFKDEYRRFLEKYNLDYDERYVWD
jgi:REP element-mobilizing transposase RayT